MDAVSGESMVSHKLQEELRKVRQEKQGAIRGIVERANERYAEYRKTMERMERQGVIPPPPTVEPIPEDLYLPGGRSMGIVLGEEGFEKLVCEIEAPARPTPLLRDIMQGRPVEGWDDREVFV